MDQLIHMSYALSGIYFFTMLWGIILEERFPCWYNVNYVTYVYGIPGLQFLTGRLLKSVEVDVSWASLSNWMVRQGGTC